MTIGEILRNRRKELNMTQEDIASALKITKATVSRWESGDIHKMKLPMVEGVCRILGLDRAIFFQREEVLMPDEAKVVDAYRKADEGIRTSVRILLGVREEASP